MLSEILWAAIETARAGDAGRGFAVVPSEANKLSEKTMSSTIDVGSTIKNIQKSVSQRIGQVDRAVSLIEKAPEKTSMSGHALAEIVTLIDQRIRLKPSPRSARSSPRPARKSTGL